MAQAAVVRKDVAQTMVVAAVAVRMEAVAVQEVVIVKQTFRI